MCWNRADFVEMRNEIELIDWNSEFRNKGASDCWLVFKNILENSTNKHVPKLIVKSNNGQKWLNREIIKMVRKKKRLWKEYRQSGSIDSRQKYEEIEKTLKKAIKKAKRKQEKELAKKEDRNGKKFTSYIKSKTKVKTGIGPLKKPDGTTTSDDNEMANILNKFFTGVFTKEDKTNIPTKDCETNKVLTDIPITAGKIEEKIENLRKDSAPGPDGIHPRLLKELKRQVAVPLAIIFRKSIDETDVPEDWKKARVVPIYKKGPKSDPGNYRPVSLTSVPCKLLESLIKDAIMEHLGAENLIKDSQHGFIPGRSCASNLTIFLDALTKVLDSGKAADVFYLDFAKAFDKVPHARLIVKVRAKGIGGKIIDWLEAWLHNRTQAVAVNNEMSEESEVESGIPQGTIMGPPLFTIFIDDIDDFVKLIELLIKFADDNKGFKIIETEQDRVKLQQALDSLCNWANTWSMQFNVAKCKIMHVGRANPGHKYYMYGTELTEVEEEKDVGVIIHKSLKPAGQCAKSANTAGAVLRLIQRNFHYRDRNVFVKLYKQYVRPHLEFSTPAWAPWTVADINILENVQRKAVGMVSGLKSKVYEERCAELGLKTLEARRYEQDMALVYKFYKGVGKLEPGKLFNKIPERTGPVTRLASHGSNFAVPVSRLDVRKNSFAVRSVQKWNELPPQIKESTTCDKFKRALKKHVENGGRPT
jgi:hypothetical protein